MDEMIRPCPYRRNPDPQGHSLQVLPEDLEGFLEFKRVGDKGFRVACSCTANGPVGPTRDIAIERHNNGLSRHA